MLTAVQKAFSKQASHYDDHDATNQILINWRKQIYAHVKSFIKPGSKILELNAGTGIDAVYFSERGHSVHATEISPGMIEKIKEKIKDHKSPERLTVEACSFESLEEINLKDFDYVFSNMGGLNCCEDLARVAAPLHGLLKNNAYVTLVVMPTLCPWELLSMAFNRIAYRRFKKGGTIAHLEGEYFKTYYHSFKSIRKKFGSQFHLVRAEGLGALSPPPSSRFWTTYPRLFMALTKLDNILTKFFPFNRWADHIIVTFQYKK